MTHFRECPGLLLAVTCISGYSLLVLKVLMCPPSPSGFIWAVWVMTDGVSGCLGRDCLGWKKPLAMWPWHISSVPSPYLEGRNGSSAGPERQGLGWVFPLSCDKRHCGNTSIWKLLKAKLHVITQSSPLNRVKSIGPVGWVVNELTLVQCLFNNDILVEN